MAAATITATVLIENTAGDDLESEHGLSVLVQAESGSLLFDTGAGDMFVRNADRLGLDLSAVGAIVVSHGHHDHAGGLNAACRLIPDAPVWLHSRAFARKFSRRDDELRYAGVPEGVGSACAGRFRLAESGEVPMEGMQLVAARESRFPRPAGNDTLFVERDGALERDPFEDELSLVVIRDSKLMLISGCSHTGIANIVHAVNAGFPDHEIEVLAGGLHTRKDPPDSLEIVAERLSGIQRIYAGHCTGDEAFSFLQSRLGDVVRPCPVGTRIHF